MCVCVQKIEKIIRSTRVPLTYVIVSHLMWVLGMKLVSSARVASTISNEIVSLVPGTKNSS